MEQSSTPAAAEVPEFESAFKLFRPSINAVRVNIVTMILLLVLLIVPALLIVGFVLLLGVLGIDNSSFGSAFWSVFLPVILGIVAFSVLYAPLFGPALLIAQIRGVQGRQVIFSQAFKGGLRFYWRYIGLTLVLTVMSIVAFLLLIVPFLFVLQRYMLSPYYLVDRDLKISEALKQSAADAKQYEGAIWGVVGVYLLIGALGGLPLIGSIVNFVGSVLYSCAPAVRYVQIKRASGAGS